MIGGAGPAGWAQRTAQMYTQIADGLAVEMENDPSFANITESEKLAITLPIRVVLCVARFHLLFALEWHLFRLI